MTSTSRAFRRLAMGLALLQFVLQGMFAVADGRAAVTGESVRPHIESTSNASHHAKAHTDDCQLCQFLANGTGPLTRPVAPPLPAIAVHTAPVARDVHVTTAGVVLARLPRGPPAA